MAIEMTVTAAAFVITRGSMFALSEPDGLRQHIRATRSDGGYYRIDAAELERLKRAASGL